MIELRQYHPTEEDRELPCWILGVVEIAPSEARNILGVPHFVETHPYSTAGGTEDHWSFRPDGFPKIFLRLRVPYSTMDVHVVSTKIPDNIWDLFDKLFPGHQGQKIDRVFDLMRGPDDPKFYYDSGS